MKLGKTLDLSKCFYDKDHWTHPDLKEGHLYIISLADEKIIFLGDFRVFHPKHKWNMHNHWRFYVSHVDCDFPFGYQKDKSPIQEGWKHIQEVIL
jgi:hypothetical protein